MLINEKVFRLKSPEAMALSVTMGRYFLFRSKDWKEEETSQAVQDEIDKALMAKNDEIREAVKVKSYVC